MKGEAFDVLLGVFKLSKDSWQPCLVVLVTIFTLNLNTNITLCNHLTGMTLIWKDGQSSIQFCGGMNLDVKHLFFQHYWKIQMIVPEWYNRLVDYTRKYWFFYESLSKTNGSIVQWPNHSEKNIGQNLDIWQIYFLFHLWNCFLGLKWRVTLLYRCNLRTLRSKNTCCQCVRIFWWKSSNCSIAWWCLTILEPISFHYFSKGIIL